MLLLLCLFMREKSVSVSRCLTAVLILGLAACASLPPNTERAESQAFNETQGTALADAYARLAPDQGGESGFYLLANGLDAFVARAALASAAERSIDTQYYMIHGDVVGTLFIDALYKAAERGVRVRLLVDDIDQEGKDAAAAVLDAHPNIEVRIFNPFGRNTGRTAQFVTGFGKQTRRAHNKSFTVDNQATVLGGRNIGDEYFNADSEINFADMDVVSLGPVAREVSASFDLYWNDELSYPILALLENPLTTEEAALRKQAFEARVAQYYDSDYLQHLRDSDLANKLRQASLEYSWGVGTVVADDPEKLKQDTSNADYRLIEQLRPYMEGVEKEIIIFSPYFVPGKSGVAFFQSLRDKGVRVRILTNALSSTDVSVVHAGYSKYRKALLRMGVELYELNMNLSPEERKRMEEGGIGDSRASLHAKAFVFDREEVFIGSLNLDPRSVVQNTEIGVVFQSPKIAAEIANAFDGKIDRVAFRLELQTDSNGREQLLWHGLVDGEQQTLTKEPYTGFWKRFGVGFVKLLPVESQI
jgi:putative cardiolipin synthase